MHALFKTEVGSPDDRKGAFKPSTPRLITQKKSEPPLPLPFELPKNYSASVMVGLKQGILSGRKKTKFMSTIASSIFLHKSYPTTDEYNHVCQQIIAKFPFFKSRCGSGYVSSN